MSTNDAPRSLAAFLTPDASTDDARIAIDAPVARIGQGPQNDVILDDDTVSTHHARLEYVDGGWRLTDLESKNGTTVDGVKLAPGVPTPLPKNAEVTFGAHRLIFLPDPGVDADAAAATYTPAAARTPLAERSAFRLPLWLFVAILLVVAILVTLVVIFGGTPDATEPVTTPVTALLSSSHSPLAA